MTVLHHCFFKVFLPPFVSAFAVNGMVAQESTIYLAILSYKKFVVGAPNPQTGLFISSTQNLRWQHVGWNTGRVFALAVDPSSDGKIIWAACGNGALKTTDAGKSWKITTNWEITEVLQVAIDPVNTKTVYIGTAYGVFKTLDGGVTWRRKNRGLNKPSDTFISALVVDRSQPKAVFIGTENGLYVSRNGAESWSEAGVTALKGKGIRRLVQSALDPKVLVAGTEDDGIFKTTDRGKSWQQMNRGLSHPTVYAVAIDPKDENIMYAGGYGGGIYKTTDGGRNWINSSLGLDVLDVHSLVVNPSNSSSVFAGTIGGGVFRSIDGGQSWQRVGFDGAQVWNIVIR